MKSAVKKLAAGLACLAVLPAVVCYRGAASLAGPDRAFPGWSQFFALFPGLTGQYLRRAFYSLVLDCCDEDACLGFGSTFSHPTASVGRNVYIGSYCTLGAVTLKDDVLIASNVSVMNGSQQHGTARLDIPIREQPGVFEPVTIGEGSWLGERCVVSATVGKHAIVGAGAVVTKPVPDYAIVLGVPAKVVRYRNTPSIADRLEETQELATSALDSQDV